MKYIALIIVASGIGLLIFSLKPVRQITTHHQMTGWRILIIFIYISLLGYLIFFGALLFCDSVSTMMILMAVVLLAGSLFVILSVNLSLNTILATNRFALAEQKSALHDSMTGLANRKYMFQSLRSFIHNKQTFSLLFIDLNNFKQINDGLGHYFGDKFLVSVAARLQQCSQTYGDLFRIGGDEFAIMIPTANESKILQLIHEIHQALQTPIEVASYTMKTSASIGVTQYPENGKDVSDLVKQADLAMYNSKRKHKPYTFYDEQLGSKSYEKLQLSKKLSAALDNNEFELHYQPIILGEHRQLSSLEVLIRWPQQDGQFISPADFIPIAEKSALISALTRWVIEHSTHDLETLRDYGFEGSLHINLSAKDFLDSEVTEYLRSLIISGKISPDDFVFEITENAVFEDIQQAKRVINEIHTLGFKFSLDDFGTGYSSLIILRELPIQQIKIDRSFIIDFNQSEANRTIIYALIQLAKDLRLSIVAEGVEGYDVEEALVSLGCTYLQGYLYSRPISLGNLLTQINVQPGANLFMAHT